MNGTLTGMHLSNNKKRIKIKLTLKLPATGFHGISLRIDLWTYYQSSKTLLYIKWAILYLKKRRWRIDEGIKNSSATLFRHVEYFKVNKKCSVSCCIVDNVRGYLHTRWEISILVYFETERTNLSFIFIM